MTPREKMIFDMAQILFALELDAFFKKNSTAQKYNMAFIDYFFTKNPKQKKLWDEVLKQITLLRKEGLRSLGEKEVL